MSTLRPESPPGAAGVCAKMGDEEAQRANAAIIIVNIDRPFIKIVLHQNVHGHAVTSARSGKRAAAVSSDAPRAHRLGSVMWR
jgi:hypothetical protein